MESWRGGRIEGKLPGKLVFGSRCLLMSPTLDSVLCPSDNFIVQKKHVTFLGNVFGLCRLESI